MSKENSVVPDAPVTPELTAAINVAMDHWRELSLTILDPAAR